MRTIALLVLWTLSVSANVSQPAQYYRFWQGFKRSTIERSELNSKLPEFMNLTVSLYEGKGLNNYMVAVPPENKPDFIPDEFALVAFESEEAYKKVKQTPEGQAYTEKHWEIFEKEISKSAPMENFDPNMTSVKLGTAYNVFGKPLDLPKSHVMFFVGAKKAGLSVEEFSSEMVKHINFVAERLGPQGLIGYLPLATENYEVAYLVWESAEAAAKAFASPEGIEVRNDADRLLDGVMFESSQSFSGSVSNGSFYSTIQ